MVPIRNARTRAPFGRLVARTIALSSHTSTSAGQSAAIRKTNCYGVNADGSSYHWRWTAHFDGKSYPYVGNATADMVTIIMIDASTLDATFKKSGKVNGARRYTVSKAGRRGREVITPPVFPRARYGQRQAVFLPGSYVH